MQPQIAIVANIGTEKMGWRPELVAGKSASAPVPTAEFKALDAYGTVVLVGRDQEVYAEGDAADYWWPALSAP